MNRDKRYLIGNVKIWLLLVFLLQLFLLGTLLAAALHADSFKLVLVIGLIAEALISYVGYLLVYRKYKQIDRIIKLYTEGYLVDNLLEQNINVSPNVNKALHMLGEGLNRTEILNISKKQAQYLALQNQINPHFLYNTLESIRSEALCSGMDGVASMTEALATFFRYTISNVDKLVTLEDELSNIENYYIIQQYRFGDKLSLSIEYDDDVDDLSALNLFLPKLVLQPIVENSIYHGIEPKIGKGNLKVRVDRTYDRLIIRISDDGMGIPEELLEELNNKLLTNSMEDVMEPRREKRGGIAIINVNNRIKLLFGEEYGVYIYSTKDVGTDVEITLPVITEQG